MLFLLVSWPSCWLLFTHPPPLWIRLTSLLKRPTQKAQQLPMALSDILLSQTPVSSWCFAEAIYLHLSPVQRQSSSWSVTSSRPGLQPPWQPLPLSFFLLRGIREAADTRAPRRHLASLCCLAHFKEREFCC